VVSLRPLTDDDVEALVAVLDEPSVRRWWGDVGDADKRREDLRYEGRAFAIEVDGELAGWLGYEEELTPDYKSAAVDLFLAPRFQGRGVGPEALRRVARWLIDERGHHRITIDPAVANERAIRAYRSVGFRDVGVMRRYSRREDGVWEDNLLMDLLADELS
jgi:aminoglycoside 6'-N-acetyltransferase